MRSWYRPVWSFPTTLVGIPRSLVESVQRKKCLVEFDQTGQALDMAQHSRIRPTIVRWCTKRIMLYPNDCNPFKIAGWNACSKWIHCLMRVEENDHFGQCARDEIILHQCAYSWFDQFGRKKIVWSSLEEYFYIGRQCVLALLVQSQQDIKIMTFLLYIKILQAINLVLYCNLLKIILQDP